MNIRSYLTRFWYLCTVGNNCNMRTKLSLPMTNKYGKSWHTKGVPLLNKNRSLSWPNFLTSYHLFKGNFRSLSASCYRKDESDAESSRETSSDGSSNYERGRRSVVHGTWAQKNIAVPNVNAWKEITDKSKPSMGSSSDESETSNPPGRLVFEYMERDTPYSREPLCDKVSSSVMLVSKWIFSLWF